MFIQVKIRFNECTISNNITNAVINAFPVVKYDVTTIIHKIFETNSSFHVKYRTTGKV